MDNGNTQLFYNNSHLPLAEKLRPKTFDDFVGQEHILGEGKILRRIIVSDRIIPMIFWGPPGCGKTTLARIIAQRSNSNFVFFSAVTGGVGEARKIINQAKDDLALYQKRTILFVDEIHRFNKSQQDYLLPHVENGTVILLGATTENPSFEVNAPLLSRARVFHFRELSVDDTRTIIKRALSIISKNPHEFFPKLFSSDEAIKISIKDKALKHISEISEGDARDTYNALELAIIASVPEGGKIVIDEKLAEEAIQQKFIRYDKGADGHYDAISALHKSIRNSDVDAALHYLARMLEAGENPLYIMRRLIRCAAEDIGLEDPQALILATATQQAVHFVGMPESNVIIAELVIYLSLAKKSRAVDTAYSAAKHDVINKRLDPIPLLIRNAPTKLMKDFGFGKGYKMYSSESFLPENLKGKHYWKEDPPKQSGSDVQ
ncbi:MAG: Replication-associated recombination protein A [bacterium ADurb.Bin400]|nr:MAG: Replication-associated recombination protein A [bacterium ADurb.Bin400]